MLWEAYRKLAQMKRGGCYVYPALGNNTVAQGSKVLLNTIYCWIFFFFFAKSNKGFKQKQVSSLLLVIALHVT